MKILYSGLSEAKQKWSDDLTKSALDFLLNNPWSNQWGQMYLDRDQDNAQDIDMQIALSNLQKENNENICTFFSNQSNNKTKALINNIDGEHILSLTIEKEEASPEYHTDFLNYWMKFIPKLKSIEDFSISHFLGDRSFVVKHNIGKAKSCGIFTPQWLHILGPSKYNDYTTKEKLLGVPAYKVEELHDDIVMFQTYENPFEYDTPEAINYMREVADYLRTNRNW